MKSPGSASGKIAPSLAKAFQEAARKQLDGIRAVLAKAGKAMDIYAIAKAAKLDDHFITQKLMEGAFESHGIFFDRDNGTFRLVTRDEKAAGMNKYGVFLNARKVHIARSGRADVCARLVCADGRWYAGFDYRCAAACAASSGSASIRQTFASEADAIEDVKRGARAFFRSALPHATKPQTKELQDILGKLATPEQRAELEDGKKISEKKRTSNAKEREGGAGAPVRAKAKRASHVKAPDAASGRDISKIAIPNDRRGSTLSEVGIGTAVGGCAASEAGLKSRSRRPTKGDLGTTGNAKAAGAEIASSAPARELWELSEVPNPVPVRMVAVNPQPDGRVVLTIPTKVRKHGWDYVHVELMPREVERLRRHLLPFRELRPRPAVDCLQLELFNREGRKGREGKDGAK